MWRARNSGVLRVPGGDKVPCVTHHANPGLSVPGALREAGTRSGRAQIPEASLHAPDVLLTAQIVPLPYQPLPHRPCGSRWLPCCRGGRGVAESKFDLGTKLRFLRFYRASPSHKKCISSPAAAGEHPVAEAYGRLRSRNLQRGVAFCASLTRPPAPLVCVPLKHRRSCARHPAGESVHFNRLRLINEHGHRLRMHP